MDEEHYSDEYYEKLEKKAEFERKQRKLFQEDLEKLKKRIEHTNFQFESNEDEFGFCENILIFPQENKKLIIEDIKHVRDILDIQFEKYSFLNKYVGIYSTELNKVEVLIKPTFPISGLMIFAKLFGQCNSNDFNTYESTSTVSRQEKYKLIVNFKEINSNDLNVSIAYPSKEFITINSDLLEKYCLTVKIDYITIENIQELEEKLQTLLDSILFQIDLICNIPLTIVNNQQYENKSYSLGLVKDKKVDVTKMNYDHEPLVFYRYASELIKSPLLRYLAYYQTIEYYLPKYSARTIINKLKEKLNYYLKDINYDIDKLLNILEKTRRTNGEKSLLIATLGLCVEEEKLKSFLEKNTERKEFLLRNKEISEKEINVENPPLYHQVARRIYDIRCKIVHTKSNYNYIKPFSKEVEKMKYDIDLVKFISQQLIISNGDLD